MNFDPYLTLGVDPEADLAAIKSAYRAKARVYHPDAGETADTDRFAQCQLAYDILSNPERRRAYDERGIIDDNLESNRDVPAWGALLDAFHNALGDIRTDPSMIDLKNGMLTHLANEIKDQRDTIFGARKLIRRLRRILELLTFNGQGVDIIGEKVRADITESEGIIEQAEIEIKVMERATALAEEYEYETWTNGWGVNSSHGGDGAAASGRYRGGRRAIGFAPPADAVD